MTNYGMKQKKIFQIYGYLDISHRIKEDKKVQNYSFNLYAHSHLHIHMHVLTSHVWKTGEL